MSAGSILLVAVIALVAFGVLLYNRLVALRNRHVNAFSQIDVQLQRRHELIPNLVETARAYLRHERETLTDVTRARDGAEACRRAAAALPADAARVGALASAEGALGAALGRLKVVMEAYPELTADAQMRELAEALETTENRVGFARQAYSDAVMRYNVACEQFPAVLVARLFRFAPAAPFELDEPSMRHAVEVRFA